MRLNRSWALPAATGWCLLLAAVCAGQTTVYSNITANAAYPNAVCVTGATNVTCPGPTGTQWIAAYFTPSATYTLTSLSLALVNYSGTNSAVISLHSDSGGQPGATLQSWTVTSLPAFQNPGYPASTTVSVTSVTSTTLQVGQTYWIEVQTVAPETEDDWYFTSQAAPGGFGNFNGTGWAPLGAAPAFAVYGNQTSSPLIITAVSPASPGASSSAQTLSFSGSGFQSGMTALLLSSSTNVSYSASQVVVTSSTNFQISAVLINPGTYSITVTNPNNAVSAPFFFTVGSSSSGSLGVSPTSVSYIGANGQLPPPQIVTVTSSQGSISYGVSTQYGTSGPSGWITTPASGVASPGSPSSVSIAINTALPPGTYSANVVITNTSSTSSPGSVVRAQLGQAPLMVSITYIVNDLRITSTETVKVFGELVGAPAPIGQTLQVGTVAAGPVQFTSAVKYPNPPAAQWLSAVAAAAAAPTTVTVSVQPGSLPAGTYTGYVNLNPTNTTETFPVIVTLVIKANPDDVRSFTYQINGAPPPTQPEAINLNTPGPFVVTYASDQNWLSATAAATTSPTSLTLSAAPGGSLQPGTYAGIVAATDASGDVYIVSCVLTVTNGSGTAGGGGVTISHVADGGGWSTTIILVNTGTVAAPFSLQLTGDGGNPFALALVGLGNLSTVTGTIAVGGSRTISTSGTAKSLTEGWARVTSAQSLNGTAIFRLQQPPGSAVPYQEAAVPLLAAGNTTLLFPFDNDSGLATGFALAAPDNAAATSVTRHQRSQYGTDITTAADAENSPYVDGNCISLPAHGHCADLLNVDSTLPQNLRGVAEFDGQGGPIFGLGIRSNGGAFTSVEAVTKQPAATKVISHVADGGKPSSGRWKTTIILVNTDTAPASFTVNFWQDNGAPFAVQLVNGGTQPTVSGSIPVGGTFTIETADVASVTTTGWAEVLSGQSVGGTAIFREEVSGQEAAVPLLTSGGTKLRLPFDVGGGLALGVALANQSTTQDANVTYSLTDESGNPLRDANSNPLTNVPIVWGDGSPNGLLPRHQHKSFVLSLPPTYTTEQRGVVEFDSSSGIFMLGIRANAGAFTSVRALGQ